MLFTWDACAAAVLMGAVALLLILLILRDGE